MEAIVGAVGRLTDAGMNQADAVDTVLRILRECDQKAERAMGGNVADPD